MTAGLPDIEPTSLDLLRGYECPNGCEYFAGDEALVSEADAFAMIGGDEHGVLRCIDCDAELEQTIEAALDLLAMVAERHPELAPGIENVMEAAGASSAPTTTAAEGEQADDEP